MISVIIPTYQSPEALDLCLQSAINGQINKNEIIVVVDGFYDFNKEVLEKWKESIKILNLPHNMGLCYSTNIGVYYSTNEKILIVNDDNVFPKKWDEKLNSIYQENAVISPNQIEPYPSIFRQFHIKDLGRSINTFNLEKYWEYEEKLSRNKQDSFGSTLPIFMSKIKYWTVGGWDINYPSGLVADWDFFLKCDMINMSMIRTYNCHFYHFVSFSINQKSDRQEKENIAHNYGYQKWGSLIQHNNITNKKFLKPQ